MSFELHELQFANLRLKKKIWENIEKKTLWALQEKLLNSPLSRISIKLIKVNFEVYWIFEKLYPDPENRKKFDGLIGYIKKFLQRNSIKLRHMHGEMNLVAIKLPKNIRKSSLLFLVETQKSRFKILMNLGSFIFVYQQKPLFIQTKTKLKAENRLKIV